MCARSFVVWLISTCYFIVVLMGKGEGEGRGGYESVCTHEKPTDQPMEVKGGYKSGRKSFGDVVRLKLRQWTYVCHLGFV